MTFSQKLDKIIIENNSLVCVGLDSDIEKIPSFLKNKKYPQFEFNKAIIDATHDLVCSYKPNIAFYEAEGVKGLLELKKTMAYLKKNYPKIPVILDAKRADIGSTNQGYVKFIFDYLKADAVTVNPYLGEEALAPFLAEKDKGIIVLCKTSNPGAAEFQDLYLMNDRPLDKSELYKYVAYQVSKKWNKNKNCFLVVGATYPQELKEVRKIVGEMTLLIPGVGRQGGDLEKVLAVGLNSEKKGLIINSSRAIIFCSFGKDFDQRAREEAKKLKDKINLYRKS